MAKLPAQSSAFGRQLKGWRRTRGLSQLQLATRAGTTPRHVSFIETGRSRPGRDVVLRIAESLDLRPRDQNELLAAAGLSNAYAERTLDEAAMKPALAGLHALLDGHAPYPAAVIDEPGKVHLCNAAYERLRPGACDRTPEELIDGFYGEPGRAAIENWAEVAWSTAELRRRRAENSGDPRLADLAERALAHLKDVPRPDFDPVDESPLIVSRLRFDEQVIATYSAVLRFESAREVTLSELRVELIYPDDEAGAEFFRSIS